MRRDGTARSALVVSCASGPERAPQPAAGSRARELCGLLGDPATAGFQTSLLVEPTAPALRQELARFFADRLPGDLVVVHLSGRVLGDGEGGLHLCVEGDTAGQPRCTLPLDVLAHEAARCRSERVVLLLDCPAFETTPLDGGEAAEERSGTTDVAWAPHETSVARPGALDAGTRLRERLGPTGRFVCDAPAEAVIELLRGDARHSPPPDHPFDQRPAVGDAPAAPTRGSGNGIVNGPGPTAFGTCGGPTPATLAALAGQLRAVPASAPAPAPTGQPGRAGRVWPRWRARHTVALSALALVVSLVCVASGYLAAVFAAPVAVATMGWSLQRSSRPPSSPTHGQVQVQDGCARPDLHQTEPLGEGIAFYKLYMLRRSRRSKDYFRHH